MAFASSSSLAPIGFSCTNYAGGQVTITVPSNGYVVVQAQVLLWVDHVQLTQDRWLLGIGSTAVDCGFGVFSWYDTVPADTPSDSTIERSAFLERWLPVIGGNAYTFYVNGMMEVGAGNDDFVLAAVVAVFYPS
jgi:hypothetical protein